MGKATRWVVREGKVRGGGRYCSFRDPFARWTGEQWAGFAYDDIGEARRAAASVGGRVVRLRPKRPRAPKPDTIAAALAALDDMRRRFGFGAPANNDARLALEWADIIESALTEPPTPDDPEGWRLYAPERARGRARERMGVRAIPELEALRAYAAEGRPLTSAIEAWRAVPQQARGVVTTGLRVGHREAATFFPSDPFLEPAWLAGLALLEAAASTPIGATEVPGPSGRETKEADCD